MTLNGINDLIRAIGDVSAARAEDGIPRDCRIANIDPSYVGPPATTLPSVIFEGESDVSLKTYQVINPNYVPKANDRVIMMPVGRTYVIVGPISMNLDTGWDATTTNYFTVSAGHTVNLSKCRRIGDKVMLYIDLTLGATITVPANGDIANSIIGNMTTAFSTSANAPNQMFLSSDRGPILSACIAPGGTVYLLSTTSGATLAPGVRISFGGEYWLGG